MSKAKDSLVGRVVFYRQGRELGGGLVKETAKKGLVVVSVEENLVRVDSRHVLSVSSARPAGRAALDHVRRVFAHEGSVDLRTAWEVLVEDEATALPVAEIAALVGDTDEVSLDAVAVSLHRSGGLFKRKGEHWAPVASRVIQEREEQESRTQEKLAAQERKAAELRQVLAGDLAVDELSLDGRASLLAIRSCAVERDTNSLATDVLSRLAPGDTRPYPSLAFDIMCQLGMFEEHEDLNLLRLGLKVDFPDEVKAEADGIAQELKVAAAGREDHTGLYTIAIDDAETVEVDDALAMDRTEQGWRVHVFICDVAAAVPRDGPLDLEARRRATTIYHPAIRIPMLPAVLSEEALSLKVGEDRLVLDHVFYVDEDFRVYDFATQPAVARLDKRLTYEDADALMSGGEGPDGELLQRLAEIAGKMEVSRRAQGAVQFFGPEVKVRVVDGDIQIHRINTGAPSRRLVAEYMVGAGAGVGSMLSDKTIAAVYRTQSAPIDELNWTEENARDPIYIMDTVRKLKRAVISLQPDLHAALGLKAYCQVTSPLRRYGDLIMQRQLHSVLTSGVPAYGDGELLEAMAPADEATQEARKVVGAAERYWCLVALSQRIGDVFEALVVKADRGRADVLLMDYAVSGRVFTSNNLNEGALVPMALVHADPRMDTLVLREADQKRY